MIRFARQEQVRTVKQPMELIPIHAVRPNPYQPRKYFSDEAISDLADSIRQVGLLQPINVRRVAAGYELIAGERRLRACKMAGLTEIKAIILDGIRFMAVGNIRSICKKRFGFSQNSSVKIMC